MWISLGWRHFFYIPQSYNFWVNKSVNHSLIGHFKWKKSIHYFLCGIQLRKLELSFQWLFAKKSSAHLSRHTHKSFLPLSSPFYTSICHVISNNPHFHNNHFHHSHSNHICSIPSIHLFRAWNLNSTLNIGLDGDNAK